MKNVKLFTVSLFALAFLGTGCSTMAQFKIPPNTTLMVTDRTMTPNREDGEWRTTPFFWTSTSGAKYQLLDKSGKIIRSGKLKMRFRVASIFWPPVALLYWPMGFARGDYDLTKPADGFMIIDDPTPHASTFKARSHKKAKDSSQD